MVRSWSLLLSCMHSRGNGFQWAELGGAVSLCEIGWELYDPKHPNEKYHNATATYTLTVYENMIYILNKHYLWNWKFWHIAVLIVSTFLWNIQFSVHILSSKKHIDLAATLQTSEVLEDHDYWKDAVWKPHPSKETFCNQTNIWTLKSPSSSA